MKKKELKSKLLAGDEFEGGNKVILQNLAARNSEATGKMSEEVMKKKMKDIQGVSRDEDKNNNS